MVSERRAGPDRRTVDNTKPLNENASCTICEQTFSEKHNLYIRPILLLCRPLTEGGLDIQLETYRVEPKRSVVDTRECVVLTEVAGSRPGGLQNVMWLDPQAAYIPLQFIEKVHGHNTIQIAMHYSEDASHGWLVTKWTVSWLNPNGSLNQSADCEVTREQINVPIDPGECPLCLHRWSARNHI